MTAFDALNQLTDIEPAYIEDAESGSSVHTFLVRTLAVIAACLILICAAVGVWTMQKKYEPLLITEYDHSICGAYSSPKNGEVSIYVEVSVALEQHKDENVLFWVALDVFSEDGHINFNEAEMTAECERLAALGYDVYVHKRNWIGYWGEDKHFTTVHLKLTAEEMLDFENTGALDRYGYMFAPGRYDPEENTLFKPE